MSHQLDIVQSFKIDLLFNAVTKRLAEVPLPMKMRQAQKLWILIPSVRPSVRLCPVWLKESADRTSSCWYSQICSIELMLSEESISRMFQLIMYRTKINYWSGWNFVDGNKLYLMVLYDVVGVYVRRSEHVNTHTNNPLNLLTCRLIGMRTSELKWTEGVSKLYVHGFCE